MQIKYYNRKPQRVMAIQYDGTEEADKKIESLKNFAGYIDIDEGNINCGLRASTKWGYENSKSYYVNIGDFIVYDEEEQMWFLVPKYDFEMEYYEE